MARRGPETETGVLEGKCKAGSHGKRGHGVSRAGSEGLAGWTAV